MEGETIRVRRTTRESAIDVAVAFRPPSPEVKARLKTPLPFFNHMLEHIAWRGELDLSVEVRLDGFFLAHVVTEDVGIALGRAIRTYVERHQGRGLSGYGFAYGAIDEALARAVVSFESRAGFFFDAGAVTLPEATEGVRSEDLIAFFEGFVQGALATVHLDLLKGRPRHGHHLWEAAFRAFGQALASALARRPERAGLFAGVAGAIGWEVTVEEAPEGGERPGEG
ncbi:hypothetical protein [Hydrogenibacillus sp. N12]|uniref:imidazoleglycerol-phosphate dehydratase n=1 Tax=Hydrogenibacillus sp. N12 TaxID=2866627 RepID=UPI001C7CD82C|nr:hypothetical protein [Hydrogenibacillus sp. N12]QZA32777.1 hypothetical protein K2M58_11050 [Hydrogenibacillus sp. N12]